MNNYHKIMGIDYGDKRLGIALSDYLNLIATAYLNYNRTTLEADLEKLAEIIKQNDVNLVVFGYPLNMDGSKSESAQKVEEFSKKLIEKINIKVCFYDERLSSYEAEQRLKKYPWQKRKEMLDMISAEIILQSYLDERGN